MNPLNNFTANVNNIIVYHGSVNSIVKNPEVRKHKFTKDFGIGFYVTNIKLQADRWASKKGSGYVSVYSLIIDNSLEYKKFDLDDDWFDFVVDCRNGKSHNFDIVEGPMADDVIFNYINQYIDGLISRKAFWALMEFKYPTHQICFLSDKSLECLKFEYSYEVSR